MAGVEAFVPELTAATIMRTIENNLIAKQICTTEYTGEIKQAGDTVHFAGLLDPTIAAYVDASGLTYERLISSDIPLLIDKQDSFAFTVKDVEAVQSKGDLKSSQTARAAYGLANACDAYILGLYAQAGLTAVTDATVDTATVLGDIGLLSQRLEEVNVMDKVIVIPPWIKLKLQLAGIKFQVANGIKGQTGLQWTNDLGFDMYVSNNLYEAGTVSAHVTSVIACSRNAIAFADQLVKTRAMERENYFDIAVSGLHVYGAKVVKPNELVVGTFTEAAETAI
jgi:hypothetical protein